MDNGFKKCTLLHDKDFEKHEVETMVTQAVSEMKWREIKYVYGTIDNYLCGQFGFKKERRKFFEYKI